ncbi:MAG: sodium:proton antiporter [Caulobacter sp.]|jgi:ATP-binding protein involved in chromosome partitioning|nr:sodium:proton antiporter [Caulobacter sp.]
MTSAPTIDRDAVLAALDKVVDPRSGRGLAAAGLVQGLVVRDGTVGFMLEVPAADAGRYGYIREQAEAALKGLPGVEKAQVVLTAEAAPGVTRQRKTARLSPDPASEPKPAQAEKPAHVKRVIAVASGKGGVGKSTVSVNLACAFARLGLTVGLLDADVYGPSAPKMMGIDEEPAYVDGKLEPLVAHGVKLMSIGFMVEEGAPMIWRGPMASSAVRQMVQDVRWGTAAAPLDLLIVDLPPGTGDIHLTLVQKLAVDGVVLVSTPQEIALIDARRAAAMFAKTATPILGVIENMAWFEGPDGSRIPIFGTGGAKAEAQALGVPVLAEIPIEIALREAGDVGRPLTAVGGDSLAARGFEAAARALLPA